MHTGRGVLDRNANWNGRSDICSDFDDLQNQLGQRGEKYLSFSMDKFTILWVVRYFLSMFRHQGQKLE